MTDGRSYSELEIYRRLFREARPYWGHILLIFFADLLATPAALLMPFPFLLVVDNVLARKPLEGFLVTLVPDAWQGSDSALLYFAVGLLLAIAVFQRLQGLASGYLHVWVGDRLVLRFREQLFRHAQRLSICYHDARGMTDSIQRIQWDASAIQNIAIDGLLSFVGAIVTVVGMIVVTGRIDGSLALVALAVGPILFVLSNLYREPIRARYTEVNDLERSAIAVVQEVLGAVRVVKAFGKEDYEQKRFVRQSSARMRAQLRLEVFQGGYDMAVGLTIAAGTAAVFFFGARHVQAGKITLGELLLVVSYLGQLYGRVNEISKKSGDIQASMVSAERAFALLDETPEVEEQSGAFPLDRAQGHVIFHDVSFAYDERRSVLEHISFEVKPGTKVGIAGPTGSGKTTLVTLLTRFFDPYAGTIVLDGVDVRKYKLADLRRQFAFVLQEPVLFSTSIAENIAYARPDASDREIVEAAEAANAHTFISRLPDGYATLVGERGMSLSGGERQRISIARAFLRDSPILILDEPTSSVDVGTERAIMQALARLMEGRTTFLIAHRLSTLETCDLRLEISSGHLVSAALRPSA